MNNSCKNLHKGFPGFIYFRLAKRSKDLPRPLLLRRAREFSQVKPHLQRERPSLNFIRKAPVKVLLFKNIFNSADKEQTRGFCSASLYLASGLKRKGIDVIFSEAKIPLDKNDSLFFKEEIERILCKEQNIKFICISLCEGFFEQARDLIKFIRARTKAFIAVGGVMPTLTPEHVFVHLPECNCLIRGAGEDVLPRLVELLSNKDIDSNFTEEELGLFSGFNGFLFHSRRVFISSGLNIINAPLNYDDSLLDLNFLNKEDVKDGLNLFTSRGCYNCCTFCTSFGKGKLLAKSFTEFKKIIANYLKRLNEVFGDKIPASALMLAFHDDDFLADHKRAGEIFSYLLKQPVRIDFFQTGINSFFKRRKEGYLQALDRGLIEAISPEIFVKGKKRNLYIGTENFSNPELIRLGKGYEFKKVEKVVAALSKKKIYQSHHLILSNQLTGISDLLENLLKISVLRIKYNEFFNILTPIIPYLVSFYPSLSYRNIIFSRKAKMLNIRRKLSIKGYPEYDYPLVDNDIPIDEAVREMVPFVYNLFLRFKDYSRVFEEAFSALLFLREKLPSSRSKINYVVRDYMNYPEVILRETGVRVCADRNNLQLMITRRCQLDCSYCPIIKKNIDMDEATLFKAIDLLFTSSGNEVRIDFTGGEPLLRFDLVKKGVGYAKAKAIKSKKHVSFYMVTNLIALTEEKADFIAGEDFFLELSVDGEERFHNCYKLSRDKKINPYRVTTANLNMIFSRGIDNYAVMVANPAIIRHLYSNFNHLLKLGFSNIGINYALCSLWQDKPQGEFFRQTDKIINEFAPYLKSGKIKLSNLGSRSEPAVLNNEIMVNSDGKVYCLSDWLFEKSGHTNILPLGKVGGFKSISELSFAKPLQLLRMLDGHNLYQRKIIFNNIEMGMIADNYFKSWKKRLNL